MYLNLFNFFEPSFVFSLPVFRICHLVLPRNILLSSLVKSASAVQMGKCCLSSSIMSQGQPSGLVGLILCKEITWKWVMFASLSWMKKENFYLMSTVSAPHRTCEFHYIPITWCRFSVHKNLIHILFLFYLAFGESKALPRINLSRKINRDPGWINLRDLYCCTN